MDDDKDINNLPATITRDQLATFLLARDVKVLEKRFDYFGQSITKELTEINSQNKFILSQIPDVQSSSTRNHESLEQLRKGIDNKNVHIEEIVVSLDKRLQIIEKTIADNNLLKDARSKTLKPWMRWAWSAFQSITNFVLLGLVAYLMSKGQ